MSSLQSLRELISERLAAAAEEICRLCEGTIVQYEEELCRQRRLLEISWNPQLQLHTIDLPQHYLNKPERNSWSKEQEEPEPEPSQIKEEQDGLYISLDEEQLDLKQDVDTFMEIYEDSETELANQLSFNVTNSQDEDGNQHEESTSTTDEETDPQNRYQRTRRDRSHVQSVDSSHMSESHIISEEKKTKRVCEKTFKKEFPGLKGHMRMYTGEKRFSCEECHKSFSRSYNLTSHMLTHREETVYSCKDCSKSFKQMSYLKRHMLTHSGEKPFSCKECHKSFRRNPHLRRHMLTHTGEKPFPCKDCGRSFRHSSVLKRHLLTHTREKPFSCAECSKSFSRSYVLKHHLLAHTRQKQLSCSKYIPTLQNEKL